MELTSKKLFCLLWILSLPAYIVLLINLVLMCTERFAFRLHSDIPFYIVVGLVYFALCLWWASIVSTVGVLGCYILLILQRDFAPATRRWASVIALTAAVAFAVSYKTIPLVIPAP
jgi:hypothetical protein